MASESLSTNAFGDVQVVRMERLTIMLKALLRRWVEGDQLGFTVSNSLLSG